MIEVEVMDPVIGVTAPSVMPVIVPAATANRIIAIDPGSSSGAISWWISQDGESTDGVCNMPEGPEKMYAWFKNMCRPDGDTGLIVTRIICEDVGASRPGNAAKAAHTFSVHRGHLEMIFVALGLPCRWVRPQAWMKQLFAPEGYPTGNDNKALRKQFIYDKMVKRWPGWKFTKRQADAVALLTWALERRYDCQGKAQEDSTIL